MNSKKGVAATSDRGNIVPYNGKFWRPLNLAKTVRIGYVYNLEILNFGEFRIASPRVCIHHALRDSWILYIIGEFEIWR